MKGAAPLAAALGLLMAATHGFATPVTLRYIVGDGMETLPTIERICREFEATHPGIKIKLERVSEDLNSKVLAQFAGNVAPDVINVWPDSYQMLAARGVLMPLDELITRTPQVDLNLYYPSILSLYTYDHHLYALPREVAPVALVYYNKKLFDEAGIPYPPDDWTWTTEERPELGPRDFTWMMRSLTKKNAAGRSVQWGFTTAWPQLYFNTLMLTSGRRLWDDEERPTKITATDPETLRVMEYASDTINKHRWVPSFMEVTNQMQSSMRDEFVKGRIAMYHSGAWEIRKFRRELGAQGIDWDIALFPGYEGQPYRTVAGGAGLAILSSSRHKEAAWTFVQYMAGKPAMRAIAEAGFGMPAIRRLALEPGLWLPTQEQLDQGLRPSNVGALDAAAMAMSMDRFPEYFRDVHNGLQGTAFDILSGSRPPREHMETVQRDGQTRLDLALRRTNDPPFPTTAAWGFGLLIVAGMVAWVYWPERGIAYTRGQKKENRSAYLFLIPWGFGMGFTLGPMIYSLLMSFSDTDLIRPAHWVGVRNYSDALFVDPGFWNSLRVTFYYSFLSIPLGLMTALALALLLNQRVRGMPIYRAIFYIPSLASGVATGLIWMRVFNPENGLLNRVIYGADGQGNFLGLATLLGHLSGKPGEPVNWLGNEHTVMPAFILMGLWGAGGGTIILLAGLQGISQNYYEAATLDGANAWRRFRSVTLPLLTPSLFFSLVTGIIGSFQVFTQAFVMTGGGPNSATMFYMLNVYRLAFQSLQMGYASALAWLLFVIILVFTVIQLKLANRWVYYEGGLK